MAISEDEFERGYTSNSIEGQILDFLEVNSDSAFTADRIRNSIGENPQIYTKNVGWLALSSFVGFHQLNRFKEALDNLEEDGLIEKDIVDGDEYYRIK